MPLTSTDPAKPDLVYLYLIAGIATSPDFMEGLRLELEKRCSVLQGIRLRSVLLHPYGIWDRSVWSQLRDIRRDLRLKPGRRGGSIGGGSLLKRLQEEEETPDKLWLIGHSGGGIAALHTAEALLERGSPAECRVVQIGTPRCAVPVPLQARTQYIYAARPDGRVKDPICRLGGLGVWGAWQRRSGIGFAWNRRAYAPGREAGVPIVGGHADYFRDSPAYIEPLSGMTNLYLTIEAFWERLINPFDPVGFGDNRGNSLP